MSDYSKDYFKFIDHDSIEDVDEFIRVNLPLSPKHEDPRKDPKNWTLFIRSIVHSNAFVTSYKHIISERQDEFPSFETVLDKWYCYATKNAHLAIQYLKYAKSSYARESSLVVRKTIPEAMDLIASNPETALDYAKNILNDGGLGKRFNEGEKAILSCPKSTIGYIHSVLNCKIPDDIASKVEKIVSKNSSCALSYAKIKKQPFPLGEKEIAKDADCSFEYAKDVIKGRFELGEEAISTREDLLFRYAITVIGGKLPEKLHKKMKLNSFSKKEMQT